MKLSSCFLFLCIVMTGCHMWPGHTISNDLPYAIKIFSEKKYENKWLDDSNVRPNHDGFANICGIGYIYKGSLERADQQYWFAFRADTGEFLYEISVKEIKAIIAASGKLHLGEGGITNGGQDGAWRNSSIKRECNKIYDSLETSLSNKEQLDR